MKATTRLSSEQRARLVRLGERGVLTPEQVTAVVDELEADPAAAPGGGLWEVLGYIGGALVLGGASLLVGMSWEDLGRPERVGLLAAATLVLAGAGLVIAGRPRALRELVDRQPTRGRMVGVLFALASATSALAVGSGVDVAESVWATVTGLAVALLGYAVTRAFPVLLAAVGFSVGTVLAGTDEWFDSSTPAVTSGLVLLGAVWVALSGAGLLRDRGYVTALGLLIALAGSQVPLGSAQPWWGYGLTMLIALLCFGGYLATRAPAVLALGVLGTTVAVPEAVSDWTEGALNGPFTVLLVGVVFLAAGGIGVRLHRNRARQQGSPEQ